MYTDQNCENAISKPNQPAKVRATHPEGLEEPLVLARLVAVLEQLFDVLLRVLPLCRLLEGVRRDGALQALELERIPDGEHERVVDGLDSDASQYYKYARTRNRTNLAAGLDIV